MITASLWNYCLYNWAVKTSLTKSTLAKQNCYSENCLKALNLVLLSFYALRYQIYLFALLSRSNKTISSVFSTYQYSDECLDIQVEQHFSIILK